MKGERNKKNSDDEQSLNALCKEKNRAKRKFHWEYKLELDYGASKPWKYTGGSHYSSSSATGEGSTCDEDSGAIASPASSVEGGT